MSQMNEQTNGNGCSCECEKSMLEVPVKGVSIKIDPETFPHYDFEKYDLCEFYYFRHPKLKPGFELADGKLLENAADLYPKAWAYLQTEDGRMLCVTEEEWQTMNHATWATLADGSTVGWDGIGGAPFYVPDLATGALRLPDLRGMYAEGAGFDSLEVGGVHGDGIRNIDGSYGRVLSDGAGNPPNGPFSAAKANIGAGGTGAPLYQGTFDTSRVVPTANKNQPRAWGALGCVYLGARR